MSVTFLFREIRHRKVFFKILRGNGMIVMKNPDASIVHAVACSSAGAPDKIGVTSGIDKNRSGNSAPSAFIFHLKSHHTLIGIGFHCTEKSVQPAVHIPLKQEFVQGNGKRRGRKNRLITSILRFPWSHAPVLLLQGVRSVTVTCMQEFFRQGEGDLSSFSVTDRQIGVDQSAGGQSSENRRFFNDGDTGAFLCGGESRGHSRHASACHSNIIILFKIHGSHS